MVGLRVDIGRRPLRPVGAEPLDVPSLPGGLHRMTIVSITHESHGLLRRHAVENRQARESGPRSAPTTAASDFHAPGCGDAPGIAQGAVRCLPVQRQPEVGPLDPGAVPGDRGRTPGNEVDAEGRLAADRCGISEPAPTDESARWEFNHTWPARIPRHEHVTTLRPRNIATSQLPPPESALLSALDRASVAA